MQKWPVDRKIRKQHVSQLIQNFFMSFYLSKWNNYMITSTLRRKKFEENSRRWNVLLCSWMSRVKIAKIVIFSKAVYRQNTIPLKLEHNFLQIWKNNCQLHRENKSPRIAKRILDNKRTCKDMKISPWFQDILHSYYNKNCIIFT